MGARYQEMAVRTASPMELVVRFYVKAIELCRRAAEHHEANRIEARAASISQALAVVAELRHALDHDRGGEISRNLEALYDFVLDQLLDASLQGSATPLEGAERVLRELHGAWAAIHAGSAAVDRGA